MNDKKIIVALDSNNLHDSEILVEELKNQAFAFKIGLVLVSSLFWSI